MVGLMNAIRQYRWESGLYEQRLARRSGDFDVISLIFSPDGEDLYSGSFGGLFAITNPLLRTMRLTTMATPSIEKCGAMAARFMPCRGTLTARRF